MARLVKLTRGKFAVVDDSDFSEVSKHSWYAFSSKGLWYAARKAGLADTDYRYRSIIFMHKQLLNTNILVDHVDRDGLNNQRYNLRLATYGQNNANRTARGSSKYLGVQWDPSRQLWVARCKGVHLGRWSSEEAAAKAYDEFAVKVYGEFANCNFN